MSIYDGDIPDPRPDSASESTFRCFSCFVYYTGSPKNHVCPDGTTYTRRIEKLEREIRSKKPEDYNSLTLTFEDRKMLRGMKIKVD